MNMDEKGVKPFLQRTLQFKNSSERSEIQSIDKAVTTYYLPQLSVVRAVDKGKL